MASAWLPSTSMAATLASPDGRRRLSRIVTAPAYNGSVGHERQAEVATGGNRRGLKAGQYLRLTIGVGAPGGTVPSDSRTRLWTKPAETAFTPPSPAGTMATWEATSNHGTN